MSALRRSLNDQQIEELAYDLAGTCQSLDMALENLFERPLESLEPDDLAELDSKVFLCRVCDWWSEISDMSNDPEQDWVCEDCTRNSE